MEDSGVDFVSRVPFSPELNLIEILLRHMKHARLPLNASFSFDRFFNELHRLFGNYGSDHAINFE